MTTAFRFALLALLLAAPAAGARPIDQTTAASVDPRWLPWLGCWISSAGRAQDDGLHVCVVPADGGGVRIQTRADDRTVLEETIVPDGTARTVEEPTCRGTRRAEWSADGQLVYSSAELSCDREASRRVSGLTTLTADAEWLDIQVVTTGGQESVRVRRYRRTHRFAPDPALPAELEAMAASRALGTRLTIAHMIEASARVTPRVLEALLFETKAAFPIDSRELVALDDAGVADTVIDLMVAFSFPRKFEVRRSAGGGASSFGPGWDAVGWGVLGAEYAWPWLLNPYYSYSYYSPFGYYPWNYWDGYYGLGGGVISEGGGDGTPQPGDRHGRVVNGSGYTQVVTRAPESDGSATRRVRDGGASTIGAADGSSGSSGGSSGVSSSGYSGGGGGGGGDSGRTAVPR